MAGPTSTRNYPGLGSGLIVVGVDGSDASRQALEWAIVASEAQGQRILAIGTYKSPLMVGASSYPTVSPVTIRELSNECRRVLTDAAYIATERHPRVQIETKVVEGAAAEVLVDASAGAALLVVGSRGNGPLIGLLLGSVSQKCVARAHCPVVVVGPEARVKKYGAPSVAALVATG
jgi:nucleotide-binding universal stress UspA family protein